MVSLISPPMLWWPLTSRRSSRTSVDEVMAIGTQLDAWLKSHVKGPVCRMVQRFLQAVQVWGECIHLFTRHSQADLKIIRVQEIDHKIIRICIWLNIFKTRFEETPWTVYQSYSGDCQAAWLPFDFSVCVQFQCKQERRIKRFITLLCHFPYTLTKK